VGVLTWKSTNFLIEMLPQQCCVLWSDVISVFTCECLAELALPLRFCIVIS